MFKVVYVSSSESALSFQTLTFITAAGNRKLGLYFLISSSTTQKVKHLIHNGNYKRKLKEMIHSERNLSDDVKCAQLWYLRITDWGQSFTGLSFHGHTLWQLQDFVMYQYCTTLKQTYPKKSSSSNQNIQTVKWIITPFPKVFYSYEIKLNLVMLHERSKVWLVDSFCLLVS